MGILRRTLKFFAGSFLLAVVFVVAIGIYFTVTNQLSTPETATSQVTPAVQEQINFNIFKYECSPMIDTKAEECFIYVAAPIKTTEQQALGIGKKIIHVVEIKNLRANNFYVNFYETKQDYNSGYPAYFIVSYKLENPDKYEIKNNKKLYTEIKKATG